MPAQPQWLPRIPEILEELSALDLPVVDRQTVERLFRVGRRRAIDLLNGWGGYQAGRTFLISREVLARALRGIEAGDRFRYEKGRRERLGDALERLRRSRRGAAVVLPVGREPARAALPPGVRLEPGRLTVEFESVEDLLARLYGVAQAAAADFEGFTAAAARRTGAAAGSAGVPS